MSLHTDFQVFADYINNNQDVEDIVNYAVNNYKYDMIVEVIKYENTRAKERARGIEYSGAQIICCRSDLREYDIEFDDRVPDIFDALFKTNDLDAITYVLQTSKEYLYQFDFNEIQKKTKNNKIRSVLRGVYLDFL